MKIQVTQEDIDQGIRGMCYACPVARAINRHLREGYFSAVGIILIEIEDAEQIQFHEIDTPEIAAEFIRRFDHLSIRCTVEPIEFDLCIPENLCLSK
jgi:hypothetical protein